MCSSSKHQVVIWSVEGDSIDIVNKVDVSCVPDSERAIFSRHIGVLYTLFNETDEFFLVFGSQLRLEGEQHSGKLYQVLVYTFPDCYVTKTVDVNPPETVEANPVWFGRYTFIITQQSDLYRVYGSLQVCSVFEKFDSVELVNVDNHVDHKAVINSKQTGHKYLVFGYVDDDEHWDLEYFDNAHNISIFAICSNLCPQCDPECISRIDLKYQSPDPVHFIPHKSAMIDKHLGASICQIDDGLTQNFAVICRPTKEPDEHDDSLYSKRPPPRLAHSIFVQQISCCPCKCCVVQKRRVGPQHSIFVQKRSVGPQHCIFVQQTQCQTSALQFRAKTLCRILALHFRAKTLCRILALHFRAKTLCRISARLFHAKMLCFHSTLQFHAKILLPGFAR